MSKRSRAMKRFRIRPLQTRMDSDKDAFEGICGVAYDASDSGGLHAKVVLYLVYIGDSFAI